MATCDQLRTMVRVRNRVDSGNVLTLKFYMRLPHIKPETQEQQGGKSLSIWSCEYQQEVTMVLMIEVRYVNM